MKPTGNLKKQVEKAETKDEKKNTYTGNTLLQKTVVVDPIAKRRIRNRGEFIQYKAERTHEAIIDTDTFEKMQKLITERGSKKWGHKRYSDTTCFYQKVICGRCGRYYVHSSKKRKDGSTAGSFSCGCRYVGLPSCGNCQIAEETLRIKIAEALELENNPEWEFAGMYSDEGITATSMRNRDGFNTMIADALAGKIDNIITKSATGLPVTPWTALPRSGS